MIRKCYKAYLQVVALLVAGGAEVDALLDVVGAAQWVDTGAHVRHGLPVHLQALQAALERLVEVLDITIKLLYPEHSK